MINCFRPHQAGRIDRRSNSCSHRETMRSSWPVSGWGSLNDSSMPLYVSLARSATLWSHQGSTLRTARGCPMNKLQSSVHDEDYAQDNYAESSYEHELHFSPGLAPVEPKSEHHLRLGPTSRVASRTRWSFGKELLRFAVCGLVIAAISAAAFGSQYGDQQTIQTLRAIKNTVNGLSAELGIVPLVTRTSVPVPLRNSSAAQNRAVLDERTALPATTVDHFQRQLDTIASDVASVKELAGQLASSQKQIATQIAAMKTANDSLSERTWWLTQSEAFNPPPSKSQHKARSSPAPTATARP
jgi:hypothetical protein